MFLNSYFCSCLQDFVKYNNSCLQGLQCNILDPIPLGEGAGVGLPKGSDKMEISTGTTLYQLVEAGINNTHAAVGVVVRLRKELSKVTSVPVLIAIDQVSVLSNTYSYFCLVFWNIDIYSSNQIIVLNSITVGLHLLIMRSQ